jgi:hypothetical protein
MSRDSRRRVGRFVRAFRTADAVPISPIEALLKGFLFGYGEPDAARQLLTDAGFADETLAPRERSYERWQGQKVSAS